MRHAMYAPGRSRFQIFALTWNKEAGEGYGALLLHFAEESQRCIAIRSRFYHVSCL